MLDIKELKLLKSYLDKVNNNFVKAISFFVIHNEFKKNTCIVEVWEEKAKDNLDVKNRYTYVLWQPIDLWMIDLAIIELYKIFEKRKKDNDWKITIYRIINFIKSNRKKLNINNLDKINKLETIINNASDRIEKLKDLRDNRSHNLKDEKNENLTYDDFENLQKIFIKLYNLISYEISNTYHDYKFLTNNIKNDIENMFRDLNYLKSIMIDIRKIYYRDEALKNQKKNESKIFITDNINKDKMELIDIIFEKYKKYYN